MPKAKDREPLKSCYNVEDSRYEIGIDEVGRGPMFGRVYTAAVILPKDDTFKHEWMKDSKRFHSEKKIKEVAPQTSADLLEKSGEIFIQKSQLGGGSPMIRGFSANRILMTLDGIRLNKIIYCSGNIHNIIGIDRNILEGVEVLFGPASVMYGSDALGGAINFKIKEPIFNASQTKFNSSQKFQYNSDSAHKGLCRSPAPP